MILVGSFQVGGVSVSCGRSFVPQTTNVCACVRACVCMCVCVRAFCECVYVCVRERERKRERVCVCVCVCVRVYTSMAPNSSVVVVSVSVSLRVSQSVLHSCIQCECVRERERERQCPCVSVRMCAYVCAVACVCNYVQLTFVYSAHPFLTTLNVFPGHLPTTWRELLQITLKYCTYYTIHTSQNLQMHLLLISECVCVWERERESVCVSVLIVDLEKAFKYYTAKVNTRAHVTSNTHDLGHLSPQIHIWPYGTYHLKNYM